MRSRVATSVYVCGYVTSLISLWLAVPREVAAAAVVGLGRWWARGRRLVSMELEGGGGVVVWKGERGRRFEPVGRM
jgi:hypothetical protein